MINIENNTRNVPIYIPTTQKSIPISTGTTSTKNNMTVGNKTKKSSSSGITSTTWKKFFVGLIDSDGIITTTKTIFIRNTNIDTGTDTIENITNLVDTPAEPKIELEQHSNNIKDQNKEGSISND